jgi:hypothetical protein
VALVHELLELVLIAILDLIEGKVGVTHVLIEKVHARPAGLLQISYNFEIGEASEVPVYSA